MSLFIYLYKKMIIIRMKHEMMILDILNILKDVDDDENKFLYYYKHIKLL